MRDDGCRADEGCPRRYEFVDDFIGIGSQISNRVRVDSYATMKKKTKNNDCKTETQMMAEVREAGILKIAGFVSERGNMQL